MGNIVHNESSTVSNVFINGPWHPPHDDLLYSRRQTAHAIMCAFTATRAVILSAEANSLNQKLGDTVPLHNSIHEGMVHFKFLI